MAKITFVYPDFESLGIEYLMSICFNNGHEVDLVYYQAEDAVLNIRRNISFAKLAKKIAATNPDIAAFSCTTYNFRYQLSCARALKEIAPNIITVFGGVHPTLVPEKVLQNAEVDAIAIGEAENSFLDFISQLKNGKTHEISGQPIKGMVYKKGENIVGEFEEGILSDLDELPFPYKAHFVSSLRESVGEYRIITSRGCPCSCSYCFNSYLSGMRGKNIFRRRSVRNVIDELIWAKVNYSLRYIAFFDDCFTVGSEWIYEFCERYKKEVSLPFACMSNPNYLNKEKITELKSSGCINMQIGIQSLSEEICEQVLHIGFNNLKNAEIIKDLKEAGIYVHVDHMLGIPGDTLEFEEEAAIFYNECRPDRVSVFWLTYYPKLPILEIAKQRGTISEDDINTIEEGGQLTKETYLTGGSLSNPRPYYCICLLFKYLPLLPKSLVNLLVRRRLYRIFSIRSYFIATVLPRLIQGIFNTKDITGRSHIFHFLEKILLNLRRAD